MNKIKILHFELDKSLGGIEIFLYNLYNVIDKDKVQFDFVSRFENPAMGKELKKNGANIYKVSPCKNIIRYIYDIKRIIINGNYDIIHIHKNSAANILPLMVAKRYGKATIFVHSHNTRPSVGRGVWIMHEINKRFLWNNSDQHFACSELAGEWLYGNQKEVKIVRNGIETQRYLYDEKKRNQKRNELNISKDSIVIGNVGRFTKQKNQKRLIDIFVEFQKNNVNSFLLLIGDGELRKILEEYVIKNKIQNVKFLGIRQDIPELMMAMDVFAMPSLYEGLPIVGIEAQATGLQMLVADTISKEMELVDQYTWFSLNEGNKEIANKINISMNYDRKIAPNIVKQNGYDIQDTANFLLENYIQNKNVV